jgi:hypothetical protein
MLRAKAHDDIIIENGTVKLRHLVVPHTQGAMYSERAASPCLVFDRTSPRVQM